MITRKLETLWKYVHEFTVEGPLGTFPHDMLRYDACWPRDEGAARELDQCNHGVPGTFQITLCHASIHRDWSPTMARWESFGWRVVQPDRWEPKR